MGEEGRSRKGNMGILFFVSVSCLAISIILEFCFTYIVTPVAMEMEKRRGDGTKINPAELKGYFDINKPEILRNNPTLSSIVETGSAFTFILFGILYLILLYLTKKSILSILITIPGLFFLSLIQSTIITYLVRLYCRRYFK